MRGHDADVERKGSKPIDLNSNQSNPMQCNAIQSKRDEDQVLVLTWHRVMTDDAGMDLRFGPWAFDAIRLDDAAKQVKDTSKDVDASTIH